MKKKILFNAFCDKDSIQAQDRDAKQWAIYLNKHRYNITIFCYNNPDERLLYKNNINIIYLKSKYKIINNFKQLFYLTFGKFNIILLSKFDLKDVLFLKYKIINIFDKRAIAIPIVNQIPYENKSFHILLNSRIKLFAISHKIKDDFLSFYNKKVPVVHLSYDDNLFKIKENNNLRKKVICVGSMQIRKCPFTFANIAKLIPETDFIWIGDGYYKKWIEVKKEKEQINNLFLPGIMNQNELSKYLLKCDIFLFPSIHEGFPNVIIEAMASGLPVIAQDSYGPEAIIDSDTGYIVKSEFEMLEKLRKLLKNEEKIRYMSKNSRKRALKYSGDSNICELESFLENINK